MLPSRRPVRAQLVRSAWLTCGRRPLSLLCLLALLVLHPSLRAGEAEDADEKALREAGLATDSATLVKFLNDHSPGKSEAGQVDRLVRQLGDEDFEKREQAGTNLIIAGEAAVERLREATQDADAEVARRAKTCLQKVEEDVGLGWRRAAVRLLVRRRPAGAVEALLQYLPYAEDEETRKQVWYGLDALAVQQEMVEPALARALRDEAPARRAVAGCILGRRGDAEQKAAVKELLADQDAEVRLRAAQGLLAGRDKEGLRVLVALLEEGSVEQAWQAEELLHWLAAERAPASLIGAGTPEQRQGCRRAWERWLREDGRTLDVPKAGEGRAAPRLLLVTRPEGLTGKSPSKTWLCGSDGKRRWEMTGRRNLSGAQLLPGGRVLVVEGNRVSERNLAGTVLWETTIERGPLRACQRLPNGNLFIASEDEVSVINRRKEEVYSHKLGRPPVPIQSAEETDSGKIVCVTRQFLTLVQVDATSGRLDKQFRLALQPDAGGRVRALGNGHRLIADRRGMVLEVDAGGRRVWDWEVPGVADAIKLENAGVLACRADEILEVDDRDQVTWRMRGGGDGSSVELCFPVLRFGFEGERPAAPALEPIAHQVRRLKHEKDAVRLEAAYALSQFGRQAEPAIPDLIRALEDGDKEVRQFVQESLRSIGKAAIPPLIRALEHERKGIREGAAHTLFLFGDEAKEAVPALIEALSDPEPSVRGRAALALGSIGPAAKTAVRKLIALLEDPRTDHDVRWDATRALGEIGPEAEAALPVLLKALKGEDADAQVGASNALGAIGPRTPEVIPALIEAVKQKRNVRLRKGAARALGEIGGPAKGGIPALVEALYDRDVTDKREKSAFRYDLLTALQRFGPDAKPAVPALMMILGEQDRTPDAQIVGVVVETLAGIGPGAAEALPLLREMRRQSPSRQLEKAIQRIESPR